jgi:hypothetical protein
MGKDNSYLEKYFVAGLVALVLIVIAINILVCLS